MATTKKTKATKYVVLRGDEATGPFTVLGNYTTNGQNAAKKAAAAAEEEAGNEPQNAFFVAVPASSFYPQKPVLQLMITFPNLEEEAEAEEAEAEEEPDPEDVPGADDDPAFEAEFEPDPEEEPVA